MSTLERVRSGGRSERVRRQVAEACLSLMAEGDTTLAPVDVAARAGVSRATIYRWWPTKADLLAEALAHHTRSLRVPDTGTWASDLDALARRLARFFAQPVEVAQNAIMSTGADPAYTTAVLTHYEPLFEAWRAVVERARARGEVRDDVDADAVLLMLVSPLVLQPMLYRRQVGRAQLRRMVELTLAATAPP